MSELASWLAGNGLGQYARLFADNDVDFATLQILTEADLQELGLPFGARKRLLAALKATGRPADQQEQEQRRQLTVLFCDVAGYTSLASCLDPEILTRMMQAYEDLCAACVSRYDGYLYQRLGDGIVAFFGYPIAYEREAERAIRAALDILEGAKDLQPPLELRAGIATGIVVVSGNGRMAVGDAMNLAARLQATAERGSIAISSSVKKMAGAAFAYAELGNVALKGFPKPVPVYQVLAPAGAAGEDAPVAGAQPVGRDAEMNRLQSAWDEVCRTRSGRLVGIGGEPGIGKSRVAAGFCSRALQPGNRIIRLQCSPFHLATPLHPVQVYLETRLGFTRGMTPGERLARIEALVCGEHRLPPSDVRFVAALLSVPFSEAFGEITEPPRLAKAETLRILKAMIASAASPAPAILLFEDMHWADATTCEALDYLVSGLQDLAVLVVVTYRPEFQFRWASSPNCSALALPRLTQEQSRAIILRMTGGRTLPPALEAMIIGKTDGVPLFVEELTRTLLESGQVAAAGDRYVQVGGTPVISLPETLRGSLTARLDRLVKARPVAQLGAVIGRSFSSDFLHQMQVLQPAEVEEGLAQLVSSGLGYVEERGAQRQYVFKHALVQDAAYDSLLLSQRKSLHNRVAELLLDNDAGLIDRQPEIIAHHLTAAGSEARAAPLWLKAAQIAMQRFAISEAASHLRKGLGQVEALPESEERDLLELRYRAALGPALVAELGWGHPELSTVLEPAWRLAAAIRHEASYLPILNALWVHYMCTDKLALSLRWAERLMSLGQQTGNDDLTVVGHRAVSGSAFWQGRLATARKHGDQLHAIYDASKHWHVVQQTNTDPLTGESIYRGQYLWMLGFPDQAVAASNARDDHARRRGHPFDLAFSLTLGAQVFEFLGLPEELERRADEANAVGRRYGVSLFFEIMGEISRGVAWLRAGRNSEAAAQIERSVSRLASTGHRIWLAYLLALRGEALARLGEFDAARSVIDQSIARIEQGEERCHFAEVLRLRGWLAQLTGEAEAAEAFLRRSISVAQSQEARSWELRSATTLATLLDAQGRRPEALGVLAPVYAWFREGFATRDLQSAAAVLGRLSAAPPRNNSQLRRTEA